ncbi:MAG: hypothetical protein IJ745_07335 [Bacteroidales bacterium]|nr:hypothetical protein [Bacteroidales bacterium]
MYFAFFKKRQCNGILLVPTDKRGEEKPIGDFCRMGECGFIEVEKYTIPINHSISVIVVKYKIRHVILFAGRCVREVEVFFRYTVHVGVEQLNGHHVVAICGKSIYQGFFHYYGGAAHIQNRVVGNLDGKLVWVDIREIRYVMGSRIEKMVLRRIYFF